MSKSKYREIQTQKRLKEKRKRRLIGCGIVVIVVAAAAAVQWRKIRVSEEKRIARQVTSMFDGTYTAKFGRTDTWWFKESLPASAETFSLVEAKKRQIADILRKHRALSAETERIAARFGEIIPAVYKNGTSQVIAPASEPPAYPKSSVMVTFYPEEAARRENSYTAMWKSEFNALFIPGIDFPPALYDAVVIHEFGHALRHNKFDGKPDDPEGTEANMAEEIEMHELGGTVLNAVSNGEYDKRVNEIVMRLPRERRFDRVLAMFSEEDCRAFDDMFGCGGTDLPSRTLITQCILKVGLRFCDVHRLGMRGKIAVYRWFDENIFFYPSKTK